MRGKLLDARSGMPDARCHGIALQCLRALSAIVPRFFTAANKRLLRCADVSLAVSVRGIVIADMDGKGGGTWSAKVLGLAPMRLYLWGLTKALGARGS